MTKQILALVTGGNRGIGFEICRQLAARGCRVLLSARNLANAELTAAELRDIGDVVAVELDVDSDDSVARLAAWVEAEYGQLDILINNAGIAVDLWQSALTVSTQQCMESFNTNVFGVLRCCQAFIPLMQKQHYGRVVNISSELGSLNNMTMASSLAYRSSKTALNAVTKLLSIELQEYSNIKINAACPGWVRTDMGGSDATFSVEEGADTPIWLATLPEDGPTGGLFRLRQPYPW